METLSLKSAPEVKKVILAAFPGYRKQNAFLSVFNGGVTINSFWDGGSREYYAIVELSTLKQKSLPSKSHPFFEIASRGMANQENQDVAIDQFGNITLKHLPEGFALISSGVFCGKPATAHIYLNPANMAKLLTA